jgi:ZIP family zinc transporter
LMLQGLMLSLLAGLGTGAGGLIVLVMRKVSRKTLDFILGIVSGMMLAVSFLSLTSHAMELAGVTFTSLGFAAGSIVLLVVDFAAPHVHPSGIGEGAAASPDKLRKGLVVSLGIAIHNMPEGLAVASGFMVDPSLAALVAMVIGAHNVPEGIVSAIPLREGGLRMFKTFVITLVSGLAEPAAAAVALLLLQDVGHMTLAFSLALAAGAMAYITVDELIPEIYTHGEGHAAILGITSGVIAALAMMSLI